MRFSRGGRRRRRDRSARPPGPIGLILLGGTLAGLIAFHALPSSPVPATEIEAPPLAAVDPYEESRRSRAILEAQEGAPPRAWRAPSARAATAGGPVRVIDGDTFVHAGARIRIADIDTPEMNGRCPYETALAARATRRMRQLLAQGDFQLHPLPSGRDEDRYGRKLRVVTRDGRSLGDVMVAEGLARTWSGRREPWCR